MKAITIHGLWAWAIVVGAKRWENRPKRWSHRGPLWIHCGLSKKSDALARETLESLGFACPAPWQLDELRGCLIGVCQVVACRTLEETLAGGATPALATGPWCYELAEPRILASPIRIGGQLGLWNLPEEIQLPREFGDARISGRQLRLPE